MPRFFLIFFSFFFSLVLSILPLPATMIYLNPNWCLLTLFFWTDKYPRSVSIGIAWCLGIIMDALTASFLGTHALAFVIVMTLFNLFYRRFFMFPIFQKSLFIGLLGGICFLILFFLAPQKNSYFSMVPFFLASILSNTCAWRMYHMVEKKCQHSLGV